MGLKIKEPKEIYSMLAIGACGGNQVFEFEKYHYQTFYINSAIEDLQSLKSNIHYYHIPESSGCHRNRQLSLEYLVANHEEIIAEIKKYLDTEYIFVYGSTDGGTASGQIGYITALLEEEGIKAIPIITAPELKNASLTARKNTYDCIAEVLEYAQHTTFIIDNRKESDYEKSNSFFASALHSLLSDMALSKQGIYDRSEINSMLDMKGLGIVTKFVRKSTHIDSTQEILDAIERGIHLTPEAENSEYYIGIKTAYTKKTFNINYDEINLTYGTADTTFIGYQTSNNIIFLSGLNNPVTYLEELDRLICKEEERIKNELEKKKSKSIIKPRISILDKYKEQMREAEMQEQKKIEEVKEQEENRPLTMREKMMQMKAKKAK